MTMDIKRSVFIPGIYAFLLGGAMTVTLPCWAKEQDGIVSVKGIEFRYAERVPGGLYRAHYARETWGQLYKAVSIHAPQAAVRRLRANPEYGYFDGSARPLVSPDGRYAVLAQLLGGYVEGGGKKQWHEVSSCVFVHTATARVLTQETGEVCGGEFVGPAKWISPAGSELDLIDLAN